ncbi:protein chiffon isoform X2 [Contarinia nasturtii]|uniref:protein chiffon isoform X2 n=1 Tax=Contarinia nasturtii TaxID=265458 RepID=UPI0012D38548|nr:protein chiffon isoform X2 [Contarinia nasturtii]
MVSPSKPHHSRVASQEHLHKCKLVKGPKPLLHFKFYLDIEKQHIVNKIEKTIRELGGSIEFFLAEKVTHFVTDKPIDRDGKLLSVCNHYLSPKSLLLSQTKTPSPVPKTSCLQSLNDLNTSDEKQAACSRPKNRADAMVQRARTTTQSLDSKSVQCASSQSLTQNPMQLALNWKTVIWNIEYTLKYLEKVSLALKFENQSRTTSSTKSSHHHHHHQHKTANVKHLNGQYIKIESSQKNYRPYYQEFNSWPTINFDCSLCPFQTHSDKTVQKNNKHCETTTEENKSTKVKVLNLSPSISKIKTDVTSTSVSISVLAKNNIASIIEGTMTRKTRNKPVREAAIDACSIKTNNDDVKPNSEKCGYCEKCRVEYDVLAQHLQSKEHLNFVKNNDNYIALDNLINSGSNVENFLRLNSAEVIDESERNGMHSPKRESLISTRVNYLSHSSLGGLNSDVDNAVTTKSHKQMNGIRNDLSPSKVNNVRGKLPKYSPPITRRSQTKNAIHVVLDDQQSQHNETNSKVRPDKTTFGNSIIVDFKEDELNFISKADNDIQTKSPKQTKITINGKKKCDEPPVNSIIDDSPVLPKRLVRAFPRYKVVDGEGKPGNERIAAKNIKSNASTKAAELSARKELAENERGIRDPETGLIVKFKRVRETELSKLTVEADNFMFPKREEQPTDEDRQSTSEHDGEVSSEILSSEVSSIRDSFSTSQNSRLNVSTTSDQFTSSGRRKKRRTQYDDNFKSPAKTKQKFRASLIQSRLNSNKKTTAINGSQTPAKQLSRGAKMSAAVKVTGRGRRGKKQRNLTAVTVDAQTDNSLDDRMGENSYIGGKLLSTDYIKNLKFSFERVPSNEPWYLTFQRQDEHRERMFEYWGNTAYRKLPYELGPLPPLDTDCCLLSKLTAMKTTKQKNRRSTKPGLQTPGCSEVINTKPTSTTSGENTVSSSSSGGNSCCNANTNVSTLKSTTVSKTSDESDNERRAHTSTLSQLLLADSSLNSISLPNAISNKKKNMLLDAFGQPRKSPREHASTLASLSSLIQQRRSRIKEMNGGISPEKMPSYKAAVAAAMAAQQSSDARDSADVSESEELIDECDARLQIKSTIDTESRPMSSRRRLNQTPSFELTKTTVEGSNHQSSGGYSSDKIVRLRKGKRRQTESISSNNESISGKNDKLDETTQKSGDKTKDVDIPKMPVIEYVDPNKVARDLDDLLYNCYLDADSDLNDIPVDCSDLILVNSSKDFVEIIESVKDGPLTYRSLQRGKKRHINKTGWPSLPRKRLPKREKVDDVESALSDAQHCESSHSDTENDLNEVTMERENDNSNIALESVSKDADNVVESPKNSPISFRSMPRRRRQNTNKTDDNDEEKSRALRHDRRKIRTPFCDDNAVQFIVSTSSSDKAENSDIFTVSSDSFLDTDVNNDTLTTAKSRFSADSRLSADDDDRTMSDEMTVNNESNWHCRSSLPCNSIANEVIKQQKGFPSIEESTATPTITTNTTSILERTLMSTRSTYMRSPSLVKEPAFDLNLQPLVCVQKMSEKDLPQSHWISNLSSATTAQESDVVKPNNRANSSLKTKTSPRKLRKPRGRWYRER